MNHEPESFSVMTEEAIALANARHDREHGHPYDYQEERIRPGWNEGALMRRKKLTDKKINEYEEQGYYSSDFKTARKELMERKARRHQAREGNFVLGPQGKLIYQPV